MISVVFSALLLLQTTAPSAGMVTGRVSVEGGGQAPSSFTLPLMAVGGETPAPRPAGANPTLTIRVQIDGTFRTQVRAGEYRLGTPVGLPPGYTLQSIVYGGVDLLQNPLKIPSNGAAELLINLSVNGASTGVSVSGRVTGITPGQFQRIALRESGGGELAAALETSVGTDGAFVFPKVLPGRYIVYLSLRSVTQVVVGNQNVTGVTVVHPQDILVSGHVIVEGAQATLPAITIEANGKPTTLQLRATGTFILSLGNGENSIVVRNIPETHRLKSMTYGNVDLQKEALKLDGPAFWDIVVRLVPKDCLPRSVVVRAGPLAARPESFPTS